jgi:methylthioribose-1-phosphate isomerase
LSTRKYPAYYILYNLGYFPCIKRLWRKRFHPEYSSIASIASARDIFLIRAIFPLLMRVGDRDYRTVFRYFDMHRDMRNSKDGEAENLNTVCMIDQNLLPFDFQIYNSGSYKDTCEAIRTMRVRGAGAIGSAAGFAMAQAVMEAPQGEAFQRFIEEAREEIEATRPTARNLFYAVEKVYVAMMNSSAPMSAAYTAAQDIADEDALSCRLIGQHGNGLINDDMRIETHCNAGWLAFTDWGTALAPVYYAHREGKRVQVWVDETRPRGQGARLTAWELQNEGVPHKIIPDNAGAYLMSKGMVDMMIVGSDRIAANGDAANKIGTLEKAIAAKEYGIPFYVAAPTSTIDLGCGSGDDIPIEERDEDEVLYQTGPTKEGRLKKILVASPGSHALNPAFDVTPAEYIKGIITEKGIISATKAEISRIKDIK